MLRRSLPEKASPHVRARKGAEPELPTEESRDTSGDQGSSTTRGIACMSKENGANSSNGDGYIENWDEYFLNVAGAISRKSKDPKCRVGAVIVSEEDDDKVIIATGFN